MPVVNFHKTSYSVSAMKLFAVLKKDVVLVVSLILAFVSLLVVRPGFMLVAAAIDFKVISLLFCLMLVIQAFRTTNLLDYLAAMLLGICRTTTRLFLVLVFFIFFLSMFITNDVALLTFVPLTILVCQQRGISARSLIVLETIAANLGSTVTPMGNPQNLFLYSFYNFSPMEFFSATLTIGLVSAVLLVGVILLVTRKPRGDDASVQQVCGLQSVRIDFRFWFYLAAFVLSLLTVFRVVDYRISLVAVVLIVLVCNRSIFLTVDYGLLGTFAGFFIFVGCISAVPELALRIEASLTSPFSTYLTGIGMSQLISNVPAALLLSGFTDHGKELLMAVNVGGLGTLIASLASVISFKLYRNSSADCCKEGFMGRFTAWNLVFLLVLTPVVWILQHILF